MCHSNSDDNIRQAAEVRLLIAQIDESVLNEATDEFTSTLKSTVLQNFDTFDDAEKAMVRFDILHSLAKKLPEVFNAEALADAKVFEEGLAEMHENVLRRAKQNIFKMSSE